MNAIAHEPTIAARMAATPLGPCHRCPMAPECAVERLACRSFLAFVSGGSGAKYTPENPTREIHDAIYNDDDLQMRRLIPRNPKGLRKTVMVDDEHFPSANRVIAECRSRGFIGSDQTLRNRIARGAATWAALLIPTKMGRPVRMATA